MTEYDIIREACVRANPDMEVRTCTCGERLPASMPGYHHCDGGGKVWLANIPIEVREIRSSTYYWRWAWQEEEIGELPIKVHSFTPPTVTSSSMTSIGTCA